MDEGALDHVGGGRLGEPVDGREAERQGAVLERAELGRGEGSGKCQGHRGEGYAPGVPVRGTRDPATEAATAAGSSRGPKCPRPGRTTWSDAARRRANAAEELGPDGAGLGAARQGDRAPHLAQVGVGVVGERVGEHLGFVLAPAPQPRSRRRRGREAVVDVGGQHVGIEAVERRLAGEVGDGLVAREPNLRRRRSAPAASGFPSRVGRERARRRGRRRARSNTARRRSRAGPPRPAAGPPPHECPNPKGRSSPRWSTTASTSVAKPCQSKSSPGGGPEAPWARSSKAMHRNGHAGATARGARTGPQKPVAWASSSGGPSPPRS